MTVKVEQFGNVKNQFIVTDTHGVRYFQSYNSIIARENEDGTYTLDTKYWNYSRTTGKYRNLFLGEDKATTQGKIDKGIHKLANLN